MEKTERRNYKSDFDAIIRLKDCRGNIVPFPDCDWEAVFWTSNRAVVYKASRRGGVYVNCFNDNGQIHVVFKHHRLGSGTLKWEPHFELPNSIYPDGIQNLYEPEQLAIELVPGRGDCPATTDIEAMLPYIKFKYEDLTDAEKAELQQPATEAAERLDTFVSAAEKAETQRVADEAERVEAEKARASQEAVRESAEATRRANEVERAEAEADREKAEETRAEEFAGFTRKIDGKMDGHYEDTEKVIEDIELNALKYASRKLLIDMWIERGNFGPNIQFSKYDPDNCPEPDKPFFLNELWFTDNEAVAILIASHPKYLDGSHITYNHCYPFTKTLFPTRSFGPVDGTNLYGFCYTLETISFIDGYSNSQNGLVGINLSNTFYQCGSLKSVLTPLSVNKCTQNTFAGCRKLENIKLKFTDYMENAISLRDSPKLNIESISWWIENSERTTPLTITLHPDAYARVTDDIFAAALAKNITIASV